MSTQARAGRTPRKIAVRVRPGKLGRFAAALLSAAAALFLAPPGSAVTRAAAGQPGAYCPLPAAGEVPACLTPAQARYREFFDALEKGHLAEEQAARVEADLGRDADTAFLALSSLAYGYYRLARQVGERPEVDPALAARLEHWNRVLLDLYGASDADAALRDAVRQAAVDLREHAPAAPAAAAPAESLVEALARRDAEAGLRSPLGRLLHRVTGAGTGEPSPSSPPSPASQP